MVRYPDCSYEEEVQREQDFYKEGAERALKEFEKAIAQGRTADIPLGKQVIFRIHEAYKHDIDVFKETTIRGPTANVKALLRKVPSDILALIALRTVVSCIFGKPEQRRVQSIIKLIGTAVESEALALHLKAVKSKYMDKVQEQIKQEHSKSVTNIRRKYITFAHDVGVEPPDIPTRMKYAVGRELLKLLEPYGLFDLQKEVVYQNRKGDTSYLIMPSAVLNKHYSDIENHLKAHINFPVMFSKPRDWTDLYNGGYYIPELNVRAPMMKLGYLPKEERRWVVSNISEGAAECAKRAMNKSQGVPYMVNTKVAQIARKALIDPRGVLGLPPHGPKPKPVFPFSDSWSKHDATEQELQIFSSWKLEMKKWYTYENTRMGRKLGIMHKLQQMARIPEGQYFYCPTFIDWRGRMYFRSTLSPQNADVIKGCIDFAEKKRLGKEGLYWLWFHIANCCGFDKADPDIRVQWAKDHWEEIQPYLNDPLNIDPPEVDTAFTLLQAGCAMQEALALPNPEDYMCSVPVAIDATCSGLQHYSAMLRDETGGYYTNLIDNGTDEVKHDIYAAVAKKALQLLPNFTDDIVIREYWKSHGVSRTMAKRPVMTYVYSATMHSCIEYVCDYMSDEGLEPPEGYSYMRISIPIAKALRKAVQQTVPAASNAMDYLKNLVKKNDSPLRWVNPAGVPVINYSDAVALMLLHIHSMGITCIAMRKQSNKYNRVKAMSGISPNFIHSLDSTHLMFVINRFNGSILPIHDSFATHPSDVRELRTVLLDEFAKLYERYSMLDLFENLSEESKELQRPSHGSLSLSNIRQSRYAFC